MPISRIAYTLLSVAIILISIVLHEVAHAWAAYKLGDATAKEQGRLTLNPLAHLDPMGSVVIPLLMSLAGGFVVGYAKPVPYNPRRLRNPRRDEVLVALAGPASNLCQALVGAVLYHALYDAGAIDALYTAGVSATVLYGVAYFVVRYTYTNVMLMFFNLIPLPPLDGSKVLLYFLKGDAKRTYYSIQQYAMPILLIVLWVLPSYLNIDIVGWILGYTGEPFFNLIMGA